MFAFVIGPAELFIIAFPLVFVVALVLAIVAAVDAANHPDVVWEQAQQNKTLWIVLPLVLLLGCGVASLVVSIVYFTSIKPRLVAIERA